MSTRRFSVAELDVLSRRTLAHYQARAEAFRRGTWDHDVSQNLDTLLHFIEADAPATILDLGCGPGRDLVNLRDRGHDPVGLDGAQEFCRMARVLSGCEVLHQNFLALDLPAHYFDGIFANASLFHVPMCEISRVLGELHDTLKARGVLFTSNPRGANVESVNGDRFGAYYDFERWKGLVTAAGFEELTHYFRPPGLPRDRQPWLASAWRKLGKSD